MLEYLHRKSISCALIQETHLKQSDVARFQNKYYKLIAFSCAQNKTKGVLILVNRKLNLTIEHLDIILYLDHFDVSVSSIIKEFDNFSSLSGYKINWSKSALMPINNVKVNSSIPSFIPIKESFIYLGITIYKNIHKIARDNFNNILVKVKNDIQRWKNLKVSLQGRISTVKMNLLPRLIFFSLCYHFLPLQVTLRRSTP